VIYISGPMTGLPDLNRTAFNQAESELEAAGFKVFNPARIKLDDGASWEDYMREALVGLVGCKAVLLLDGWKESRGARLEMHVAAALRIRPFSNVEAVEE
jgi:hypothetical protein